MSEDLQVFDEKEMLIIQATAFQTKAEAVIVENDEHVTAATNLLGFIAQSKKQFEAKRTGYVKPLNDRAKTINDAFKEIEAPLDTANTILKQKILIYHREQERKRQEELARIEAERKAVEAQRQAEYEEKRLAALLEDGEILPEPEPSAAPELPPEIPTMTRAALGNATVKKVWAFKIIDPTQVPREYLVIDEGRIRAAVWAGVREIPGVRIYQDEQLVVSGRR